MRFVLCFMLLAGFVCCSGCGKPAREPSANAPETGKAATAPSPGQPIRIAFVPNGNSNFWKIAEAGTKKAALEYGCEVIFRMPSKSTAAEQQSIIDDLLVTGVSGIAISPKDPTNQLAFLNKVASKANLITQDSDAPESNRLCYIGTNNYDAGKAAGELIKTTLPSGGKIMLFVGTMDAQNAQDRKKGIEDAIAGANIEILGVRTDEVDTAKAISNVQDTLVAYPDISCLVGLYSYNGPAILNAVQGSGKLGQVKIICFDEDEETLQGVQDGYITGTVVQQPFEFGYTSVKVLVELAKGNNSSIPPSKQLYINTVNITKDNVEAFWKNLKELTGRG